MIEEIDFSQFYYILSTRRPGDVQASKTDEKISNDNFIDNYLRKLMNRLIKNVTVSGSFITYTEIDITCYT